MHSDPIADMLTRIRNGYRARLSRVDIPRSGLKLKLAEILKREGFVSDYREISGKSLGQSVIEVKLKYDEKGESVISGIQRVSRPGLRKYFGAQEVPKIRNGLGMMVLTTSKGILTDREARAAHVGGEGLCSVW